MQIAVTIEAMFGLNWDLWKDLIQQIEGLDVLAEEMLPHIRD
jgi:hypothetical protein